MKSKIIFIVGPTATGKSAVAAELASRLGGEVISCDSMQVYKGMDILTQAPSPAELEKVPHNLIGTVSPEEEYSAAAFAEKAGRTIELLVSRGKTPVVAGGTGLYMKSLLDGLFPSPPKDVDLREELARLAEEKGGACLHERLKAIDPDTAEKLHPNDTKRVIRAIEVWELSGETMHEKKKDSEGISGKYDCRLFGLMLERDALYGRINSRVEKMFEEGLVDEVKRLRAMPLSLTAGKALGIKEVSAFLDGEAALEEAKEALKKATRNYAKRQMTWFRADSRVEWLDADREAGEIASDIMRRIA